MSGIAPNSPRYMIFPHCFQIGTFTLNLGTRFLLGGRIITPGYSGHWPGYSGRGVSISLIQSSRSHKYNKYSIFSLSHPHQHSLPLSCHSLSLSLPHRGLPLPHKLSLSPNPKLQIPHPESIPRPKRLRIRVEDHLPHVFLPGVPSVSSSSRGEKLILGIQTCAAPIYVSRRF